MPRKLSDIKQEVTDNLGREVIVTIQAGRRKKKERKGVISEVYPALFTVQLDPGENDFECCSYSYTDILTNSIEIEFVSED